jgi:endo-1,4-beta-xylanase
MKKLLLILVFAALIFAGHSQNQNQTPRSLTLCQKYKSYFPIGAAVSPRVLKSADSILIIRHYNSLVCENHMKPMWTQPKENEYSFTNADFVVAFAKRNNMKLRGHTLVWHNQTPGWFFKDGDQAASKDLLKERMHKHIQTVISHFKDDVYAWDVVNEAISDGKDEFLRTSSSWYKILGEEYIELAFRYAREADPNAKLFYNDYNAWQPEKRDNIIRLVKSLQAKGIKVDGIGMQGHWKIGSPTKEQIETAIDMFAALGVSVQITELDVSVYQTDQDKQVEMTPELEQQQADYYQMCFEVFRAKKEKISGVTFWGAADNSTWLDNFPVRGRKDYPLLFDTQLQPKMAFEQVTNF